MASWHIGCQLSHKGTILFLTHGGDAKENIKSTENMEKNICLISKI